MDCEVVFRGRESLLSDWNIASKIVLVTGASSGIGKAMATMLAKEGAHTVIHCRTPEKCARVAREIMDKTGNKDVNYLAADLSSIKQVEGMAQEFKKRYGNLHVLINNAGVYNTERKVTIDGFEETLAVNYLAPFLLTIRLLDLLIDSKPSRVINVTSELHSRGEINFDDLQLEKSFSGLKAYSQSKLALTMFTFELAERLKDKGVTVNCYSPGLVRTNLGNRGSLLSRLSWKFATIFGRSPEKGAETGFWLATDPELTNVTGKHFKDRKIKEPPKIVYNDEVRARLWEETLKLLRISSLEI